MPRREGGLMLDEALCVKVGVGRRSVAGRRFSVVSDAVLCAPGCMFAYPPTTEDRRPATGDR
jgi:hypothetical protein